jgi:hypothetical protein
MTQCFPGRVQVAGEWLELEIEGSHVALHTSMT